MIDWHRYWNSLSGKALCKKNIITKRSLLKQLQLFSDGYVIMYSNASNREKIIAFTECCGLTLISLMWPPAKPFSAGWRELEGSKRKNICWDKSSLVGKAKVTPANKAKWEIHSLPMGRQVSSHLRPSRALWEGKSLWMSFFSCFFKAVNAEHDTLW